MRWLKKEDRSRVHQGRNRLRRATVRLFDSWLLLLGRLAGRLDLGWRLIALQANRPARRIGAKPSRWHGGHKQTDDQLPLHESQVTIFMLNGK
jgi:hypothetical protein